MSPPAFWELILTEGWTGLDRSGWVWTSQILRTGRRQPIWGTTHTGTVTEPAYSTYRAAVESIFSVRCHCVPETSRILYKHTRPSSTERVDTLLIAHSWGVFRLNLKLLLFATCWGFSHLCISMGLWLRERGNINHTASHLWQALEFTERFHIDYLFVRLSTPVN